MSHPMAHPKTLVLTRPFDSSMRLRNQVAQAMGAPVQTIISPVMKITTTHIWPDLSGFDGVVMTSANALQGVLIGQDVFCVGETTAKAASKAGANVRHCAQDVDGLVSWIYAQPQLGELAYLRGAHITRDLKADLLVQNISCTEFQTYQQMALPLNDSAKAALSGEQTAILPLFSVRSARLVGEMVETLGPRLQVIALSEAVAKTWNETTSGECDVARHPTGQAMVEKVIAVLGC